MRLALGASHGHVLRAVVLDAMKPVAAGILAGVAATAALSRLIASLLFEVTARDPATYVMVIALLATTALIACVLPARQALRVDVVAALRAE